MWRAWGAARRSGRRGDEPRAVTRVTRGSRGVSWWTCHGTWQGTPQVSSGSRITRSGGALGPEDAKLWCAATPISVSVRTQAPCLSVVGRHDSPAGAHSARVSLVLPTPSPPLRAACRLPRAAAPPPSPAAAAWASSPACRCASRGRLPSAPSQTCRPPHLRVWERHATVGSKISNGG